MNDWQITLSSREAKLTAHEQMKKAVKIWMKRGYFVGCIAGTIAAQFTDLPTWIDIMISVGVFFFFQIALLIWQSWETSSHE